MDFWHTSLWLCNCFVSKVSHALATPNRFSAREGSHKKKPKKTKHPVTIAIQLVHRAKCMVITALLPASKQQELWNLMKKVHKMNVQVSRIQVRI